MAVSTPDTIHMAGAHDIGEIAGDDLAEDHHRVGARDVPAHALHVHAEILHEIAGQPGVRAVVAELQRDRRRASTAGTCAAAAGSAHSAPKGRHGARSPACAAPRPSSADRAAFHSSASATMPGTTAQAKSGRQPKRGRIYADEQRRGDVADRPAGLQRAEHGGPASASARIRRRAACRCCRARRSRIPRRSASAAICQYVWHRRDDAGERREDEDRPPDDADAPDAIGEPAREHAADAHAEQRVGAQRAGADTSTAAAPWRCSAAPAPASAGPCRRRRARRTRRRRPACRCGRANPRHSPWPRIPLSELARRGSHGAH